MAAQLLDYDPESLEQPTADSEDGELSMQTIQVYCAEILTNADSVAVFDALMANGELLGLFFDYWQQPVPDAGVMVTFVRLCDFMMQKRFHAFIRAVQIWSVLPRMVMLVERPDVRLLLHAMLINEALLVSSVPEVTWSPDVLVPQVLVRFRAAMDNEADMAEVGVMCEFVTDLLEYHFRSQPRVVSELLVEFDYITSHVLSSNTEFPEEFLALFFRFFPSKHGTEEWPRELALSDLALATAESQRPNEIVDIVYNEIVVAFLVASEFQNLLANRLDHGAPLMRWRALTVIKRMIEMSCPAIDVALIEAGNVKRFFEAVFLLPHGSMVHTLVVDTALMIAELGSDVLFAHTFQTSGEIKLLMRVIVAVKQHRDESTNRPAVEYIGPFVRLINALWAMAPSLDRVVDIFEQCQSWPSFKKGLLANINADSVYDIQPAPEDFHREGTLVERLQMSQSEEPPEAGGNTSLIEESFEEIIEEEIIEEEEVIEEIVVIEEEEQEQEE